MSIGGNIKKIREDAQLTQEQLAEMIGVNRVTLAKYESDKVTPGAKVLSRIAIALHISQDKLTGIEDGMTQEDREIWELREKVRRDPERHYIKIFVFGRFSVLFVATFFLLYCSTEKQAPARAIG